MESVETDIRDGDGRKEIGIDCLSRNRLNIIEDDTVIGSKQNEKSAEG